MLGGRHEATTVLHLLGALGIDVVAHHDEVDSPASASTIPLSAETIGRYAQSEGRKIGFAFLDCNIGTSYKVVFEFVFSMLGENSYIYMDEYLQNPGVADYFEQFKDELRRQRKMGCLYVRNAGGFGGLFRLYPLGTVGNQLDLRMH